MFRSDHSYFLPGLIGIFLLIFGLVAWDLIADYSEGVDRFHVVIESLVLLVSGSAIVMLLIVLRKNSIRTRMLANRLIEANDTTQHWQQRYREAVQGLARAILEQFQCWELSRAEAEIAMLLLKGFSLKEIARLRGTGDRTVRDQARAIYRKAGLAGRSELAAFFLEDLLLPEQA